MWRSRRAAVGVADTVNEPTPRIVALIPCRDEAAALPELLLALRQVGVVPLVVDNGSRDDTAEVAESGGAHVVCEPRVGYGAACAAGLRSAFLEDSDIVVILDADGAGVVDQLASLTDPITSGAARLALGQRAPEGLPVHVRLGNRLVLVLMRLLLQADFADLGPVRAARAGDLRSLLLRDRAFGWNVEMQVRAKRAGWAIARVAFPHIARRQGRSKIGMNPAGIVRAGCGMLGAVLRLTQTRPQPGARAVSPVPLQPSISVVLPARDEEAAIEAAVRSACARRVCEVIVVDGGSSDRTVARAAAAGARVLRNPPGRAVQMNAGAEAASGEILLFLHADTVLPGGFDDEVAAAWADGAGWGRFDVSLDSNRRSLAVVGTMINLRSRLSRMATGDQAIFVDAQVFRALGGYREMPLMEDLELSRQLRRTTRPAALRARVRTSARRWHEFGVLRTVLLMWLLRGAWFVGVPPRILARFYR